MTAADRPSVTDNARAEAWAEGHREGRMHHAAARCEGNPYLTAGRAETTDEEVAAYAEGRAEALDLIRREWCPCVDGQPQDCKPEDWPTSRRHGYPARLRDALAAGRAETTTATVEAVVQVLNEHPDMTDRSAIDGCACGDDTGNEHVAHELDRRGLLATARTRPTPIELVADQ